MFDKNSSMLREDEGGNTAHQRSLNSNKKQYRANIVQMYSTKNLPFLRPSEQNIFSHFSHLKSDRFITISRALFTSMAANDMSNAN